MPDGMGQTPLKQFSYILLGQTILNMDNQDVFVGNVRQLIVFFVVVFPFELSYTAHI